MSIVLIVATFAILVAGVAYGPKDANGTRQLISGYNVVLFLCLLYVVLPSVLIVSGGGAFVWAPYFARSENFQFTQGLCLIAVVVFVTSYSTVFGVLRPKATVANKDDTRRDLVNWVILLVVVGLLLKAYVVVAGGGVESTFIRLSGGFRSETGVGEADAFSIGLRAVSGIADGAATWGLLMAIKAGRFRVAASAVLILVASVTYLTAGKRLSLLLPMLMVLIAWSALRNRPLTSKWFPVLTLATLSGGLISLIIRTFLPASAANVVVDLDKVPYAGGSVLRFYFYSLEYSSIEMVTVAVVARDRINDLFGGPIAAFVETNIVPLFYVVPRGLWPGKPTEFTDYSYAIATLLGGGRLQDADVGYASTLVGTSYLVGSVAGVVAAFALLGCVASYVDKKLGQPGNVPAVALYGTCIALIFQYFRQGTLAWAFLVTVVVQFGFFISLALLTYLTDVRTREGSESEFKDSQALNHSKTR